MEPDSDRCTDLHGFSEPNVSDSYQDGFYSTEYYTSNLLRYFTDHKADLSRKDQPFFAYLPFAAPHWPLQCSAEDRDAFRGFYDDGPDALRLKRLAALERLGIIPSGVIPHEVIGNGMKEWKDMDAGERKVASKAMEVYAGMVRCIDRNVGRVLDHLEATGELDSKSFVSVLKSLLIVSSDTFVLFMSDNGAEGAMIGELKGHEKQ